MKKKLLSFLLLPALLLSLCLPAQAAGTEELLVRMNNILDLIEQIALEYNPAVINDDLRADLTRRITEDPAQFDLLMDEVLSGLDAYSMYLPAGTYAAAFDPEASYVGVGVTITLEESGDIRVIEVVAGGPAEELQPLPVGGMGRQIPAPRHRPGPAETDSGRVIPVKS